MYTGSLLRINTIKYKKELKRLNAKVETKKHKIRLQEAKKIEPIAPASKYNILNVTQDDDSITLHFNRKVTLKDINFRESKSRGYYQDIFEFRGRYKYARPTKLKIDGIEKITIYQYKHNTLRIIAKHTTNPRTIYMLNNDKITIKFLDSKKENKTTKLATTNKDAKYLVDRSKVIVIDPGHGGKDPGAVGKGKKYEKVAVLNIAKKLHSILKSRGYRVYLTRDRDRFISLKRRTKMANDKNADIFISIHANAAHKSRVTKAKGIETFFLSPARSKRAKRVAALENQGDIDAMSWSSKESFLTVLNQGKITASNKLAIDIHKNMLFNLKKLYKGIVDGGVREGPFWVLVGAQMPSVLIEIGYITHPKEKYRLFNNGYQDNMARGIANGIDAYFAKNQL